jgi:hypothetical protein
LSSQVTSAGGCYSVVGAARPEAQAARTSWIDPLTMLRDLRLSRFASITVS